MKKYDELTYKVKHCSEIRTEKELAKADLFCEGYKKFLDLAKTEREAVETVILMAEEKGYKAFDSKKKYKAGDKIYVNNRGKALILCNIGTLPVSEGVHFNIAHIDSPRLDLKPNPLCEEADMAYLKTHYYGGIKKYQWTAIPLSLHGVVVKGDGTKVPVIIGEDEGDPVFCVTDLLPHLAQKQMDEKAASFIKGENLRLLIGGRMIEKDDEVKEPVKLNVLKLLNEKYGITEEDFLSAELTAVPSFKAADVGLDRSFIGAYGHDDRVCAYPAVMAALDCVKPSHTLVTVLTDKEEIGSEGNTGLNSEYLFYFIDDLAAIYGEEGRHVLSKSKCLSADVNSAYDPIFADAFDKANSSVCNGGVVITKYTGARGKSATSDASAEFMGEVRALLNKEKVQWQIGELGKVDIGGGGTIAMYVAAHNVDVVDLGVPVLSMHSPFEIVTKSDVYETYKAFYAFAK